VPASLNPKIVIGLPLSRPPVAYLKADQPSVRKRGRDSNEPRGSFNPLREHRSGQADGAHGGLFFLRCACSRALFLAAQPFFTFRE
jgi:hypothetical protein